MEGFLGTILAGVVVSVIGAFAAYYFGVRRERLRRDFEIEREQQERLAEQQKELNERRAQILYELRKRAYSLIDSFMRWTEEGRAVTGTELRESRNLRNAYDTAENFLQQSRAAWTWSWRKKPSPTKIHFELEAQGEKLSMEISSLSQYYKSHRPDLEPEIRNFFEGFEKELRGRQATALERLRSFNSLPQVPKSTFYQHDMNTHVDSLAELVEGFEFSQAWNYQAHLNRLDAEAEKQAGQLRQ